ncbi:MAG: autotransporter outer membrane beta-barrel domain-containing protein [Pseudomonadota bacterium]
MTGKAISNGSSTNPEATRTAASALSALRWGAAPIAMIAATSPYAVQAQELSLAPSSSTGGAQANGTGAPVIAVQDLFALDTSVTLNNGLEAQGVGRVRAITQNGLTIQPDSTLFTLDAGFDAVSLSSIAPNVSMANGANNGVNASANGANDLEIDTSAGPVSDNAAGIAAYNNGTGAASIITADVTSTADNGIYTYNNPDGGTVTIDTSAGSVTGAAAGIAVYNYSSSTVSVTTADVTGTAEDGIYIASPGDVALDTSGGSVTGGVDGIEVSTGGTADAAVTTGNVTGQSGDGIAVSNSGQGGSISVNSAAGTVSGAERGVDVRNNGRGATLVVTGDVTGADGNGIYAYNTGSGTDVTVDSSAGRVTGSTDGIAAYNFGTGALSVTAADTAGTSGAGIYAFAYTDTASLSIDSSEGAVEGGTSGVVATNYGAGTTRVTTGDATGGSAAGILVTNTAAGGDMSVDSSAGSVTGATRGVDATQSGAAALSVTTAGATGTAGEGVSAVNTAAGTAITVNTSAGSVNGATRGIAATNNGSGALSITSADVEGADDAGIAASNAGTDLTINSSAGSVTGATRGIDANQSGSGALRITTLDVIGEGGAGVYAYTTAASTDLTVDTSAGRVTGTTDAIAAYSNGSGALSVTSGDATGAAGSGIYAFVDAPGTSLAVDSSVGTATGAQNGIVATNYGSGSTSVTSGDAVGENAAGILVTNMAAGTDMVVDSTSGSVTGATSGIIANNSGSGSLSITTGDVSGAGAYGVLATNGGSDLSVDTTSGNVTGALDAIFATNNGTGSLSVAIGDANGAQGAALNAVNSAASDGVSVRVEGTATGQTSALAITNEGAGPTLITNNGSISAASGQALVINGTAADVTNAGTLTGFVTLTGNGDTFTNTGMFMATGDSVFGAGNDTFANSGTLALAGTAPVTFTGLETFENSGLVSLSDGQAGGSLNLPGDFSGTSGSTLSIDVDFEAQQADVLTIGGAATGSSVININQIGMVPDGLFGTVLVVDANEGSASDAFTIAGDMASAGLIEFGLLFDASANDYFVSTAPSAAARQTSTMAETARGAWQASADAWGQQMLSMRDTNVSGENGVGTAEGGVRGWLSAYGSQIERDGSAAVNLGGATTGFDLGYEQSFIGMLAGVDFGSETLRYGMTGGYLRSDVELAGTPNTIDYDVLTVGAYVALDTGPFFANALAKYDLISGDLDSTTGGFSADVNGSAYGVTANVGGLLGDRAGFFVEPSAEISYNIADLDPITAAQGDFAFDEGQSLLGKVGARAGKGFEIGGMTPASVFVGARYVHEFEGEDGVVFSSGTQGVGFGNVAVDDYGEFSGGISIGGRKDRVSGTLTGQYMTGEDLDGYGASLNIRVRF